MRWLLLSILILPGLGCDSCACGAAKAPADKLLMTQKQEPKRPPEPEPEEFEMPPVQRSVEPVEATIGAPAPLFVTEDHEKRDLTLRDFRGKFVVLEWFNPDCPAVQKAYEEGGRLRDVAIELAFDKKVLEEKGEPDLIWIHINSAGPGQPGNGLQKALNARAEFQIANLYADDEPGTIGRAYGATRTPEVVILDAAGVMVYRGAPDNAPSGKPAGAYRNYIAEAIADLRAGNKVRTGRTKLWGCPIGYGKKR
jgi:hypothetical protein